MHTFDYYLDKIGEFGQVLEIHHPLVTVEGLPGAKLNELVIFENNQLGQVFMIKEDSINILVLDKTPLRVGSRVARTDQYISIPAGDELLGTIIDPLGHPLSQIERFKKPKNQIEIDNAPLSMDQRARVKRSLLTGVILADFMVPLGKGQKELIIGDRKTGKTSFILSTISSQINQGAIVIYALIAKEKSAIKQIWQYLKDQKLEHSVILVATDSDSSPSLINLTPFSALALSEYFRDQGKDVVVVLDDLSTHAKFYRELSLIAKKFPGRESYPGDIFFIHARLLERAGNFKINSKEVSITALPVAETIEADITGYISTNLMGMTDGHIFFDSNLYSRGVRPAININLSVTRVGRQVQQPLLKEINHQISVFLSEYEKIQNLSHFGAELSSQGQDILATGDSLYCFFEQRIDEQIPLSVQIVFFGLIWNRNCVESTKVRLQRDLLTEGYTKAEVKKLVDSIADSKSIDELLEKVAHNKDQLLEIVKVN